MATLRQEFEAILKDYGHNILIVRRDKKMRCSCWREKEQESSVECPSCFGVGYVPIVEKHTVRTQDSSVPETMARMIQQPDIGDISVPSRAYYVKSNMQIAHGDLMVEVEWTPQGKPYYTDGGVYEVNHIEPMRWERGEIIYKVAHTKGEPVEQNIRGIRIANVNGYKNYEIVR